MSAPRPFGLRKPAPRTRPRILCWCCGKPRTQSRACDCGQRIWGPSVWISEALLAAGIIASVVAFGLLARLVAPWFMR